MRWLLWVKSGPNLTGAILCFVPLADITHIVSYNALAGQRRLLVKADLLENVI